MKAFQLGTALLLTTLSCFAQGQVVFANKVGTTVDAPVTILGTAFPTLGPGPNWSAQLFLQGAGGSLTPLTPASTFRAAGQGAAAIADRYWVTKTVDVPVQPGTDATFVVRAWQTSLGSYDAAIKRGLGFGESAPFIVAVGGGTLPPSNLTTLKAFTVFAAFPEPSTITLGLFGGAILMLRRRK